MTTVQIIVPCYNYGRYLRACVNSALSQENVDVKVLIIDDCSSDDTLDMCKQLASEDRRVDYIHHAVNKGHIATYNEGLALAESDYLVLLSADDLLTPGCLSRATALMNYHPSVGLTYGYPIPVYGPALPPARTEDTGWTIWRGGDWIERMCRAGKNFICCPEVVIRTSIQHRLGGYKASLPHSADMEMWLRAAAISDIGRINGADQAYYRVHNANMHRTVHAGFLYDLRARRDAILSAFENEAGALPDAAAMQETARRTLALTALRYACQIIDSGRAESEPVDLYREFALDLYPAAANTRQWQSLERRRNGVDGAISTVVARGHAQLREIADKYAWRRWWQTGLY
ncbi:glycosyltransferase family 2 protein [Mesorhizobium sp. DCY119]|uniref:glycosyltransferase family 2 protein n=1 Tax=Mesorhizobium sp. DCY119 TaxID=2108445 RepID=UPI000E6D23D5|nr:glycosyltransferase family 2 protein [Mesorhizobium sp. DCY119]RJG43344.1 glycosyltransferase [Mesorhizobium sp. DCY119]